MSMSNEYKFQFLEAIVEVFYCFSANEQANQNIVQMMKMFGMKAKTDQSPMSNKKNYAMSAIEDMDTESLQKLAEEIVGNLKNNAKSSEKVNDLSGILKKYLEEKGLFNKEKITAVRAKSIKSAIFNIFKTINESKESDCGSIWELAERYGFYEDGNFSEDYWSIESHICGEIQAIPDDALIGTAEAIAGDLKDSVTAMAEINSLLEVLGNPPIITEALCIVFATEIKPDIVVKNVLKKEIEVRGSGSGLVYMANTGKNPILWKDVLKWYEDEFHDSLDGFSAKESLKSKLLLSLSKASPPEAIFFNAYCEATIDQYNSLALFPQVWMQYDTRSASDRGGVSAFKHQRMDFMLFLKKGKTLILEIDGRDHYANKLIPKPKECKYDVYIADPDKYAEMMNEDRKMRFNGYEVLRYGAKMISSMTISQEIKELIKYTQR